MKNMKIYQRVLLIVVSSLVVICAIIVDICILGAAGILEWGIFNVLTPVEVPYGNWECTEPHYIYLEIYDGYENGGYMFQDGEKIDVYFTYLVNGDDCEIVAPDNDNSIDEDDIVISGDFRLSNDIFIITDHITEEEYVFHRSK